MTSNRPGALYHDQQGEPRRFADAQDQDTSSDDSLDTSEKGIELTIDESVDATAHNVLFYPDDVEVEKSSADSA